LAQFSGLAHFHRHIGVAERLAIPKTAQLETRESTMNDSKTRNAPIFRIRCIAATIWLIAFAVATRGFAQGPAAPRSNQSQGTQTTLLPLSGRNAQTGSVIAVESPIAGTTNSVNTINPTVQVQGPYSGSAHSTTKLPFSGKLSLREAIERGLDFNLGAVGLSNAARQAQGQSQVARSALLPNLSGNLTETVEQINLRASGIKFRSPIPGFVFPTIVGPFNVMDARASLTQSIFDMTARNNYRSANEVYHANQFSARDARDLVVLAVGGAYLQVIATKERVKSAHAQLDTANALYQQNSQKRGVGLVAQVDVDRSQVEALAQQQRVTSLENDLAKQKISLARMTGLPPTDEYDLTDEVPFLAAPALSLEDALKQAFDRRADLKAAESQIRAAEHTLAAARDERLPSLSLSGDYGAIGTNPSQSHGTFTAAATLHFPIWQGGRTEGDIKEAEATLAQRRAELDDLKSQVESDVRNAYLDLRAASSQVEVARKNLEVSTETLDLTRQRFEAGVTDNVEVIQAQEFLTSAELDVINSVFAHNIAKLSLARSIASAANSLQQFLSVQ
jgi:outer membrane protein TolC